MEPLFFDRPAPCNFGSPFDAFIDAEVVLKKHDRRELWSADPSAELGAMQSLQYNPEDQVATRKWAIEQLRPILSSLLRIVTCITCKATYCQLENIGNLQCRWHPGVKQINGNYTCCNTENTGCYRCDHSCIIESYAPRWHEKNNTLRVPWAILGIIRSQDRAVLEAWKNEADPARSHLVISRVSPTQMDLDTLTH